MLDYALDYAKSQYTTVALPTIQNMESIARLISAQAVAQDGTRWNACCLISKLARKLRNDRLAF